MCGNGVEAFLKVGLFCIFGLAYKARRGGSKNNICFQEEVENVKSLADDFRRRMKTNCKRSYKNKNIEFDSNRDHVLKIDLSH